MTTPFDEMLGQTVETWRHLLCSKTIRGVRPIHRQGAPVPELHILFSDNSSVTITAKPGVYFEAAMINSLRKAQVLTDVLITGDQYFGAYEVELRSRQFPALVLRATCKDNATDEFPFDLTPHRAVTGG